MGALLRAIAVSTASVMVSTIAFMEGAVAFAIGGYLAEVRRGLRRFSGTSDESMCSSRSASIPFLPVASAVRQSVRA